MKKITAILSFFMILNSFVAQTTRSEYIYKEHIINLTLTLKDGTYSFKTKYKDLEKNEKEDSFSFSDFKYDIYENILVSVIKTLDTTFDINTNQESKSKMAISFMGMVVGIMNNNEDKQKIGVCKLNESIKVYEAKEKTKEVLIEENGRKKGIELYESKSNIKTEIFKIKQCQITFEDGFIRHIIVKGTIDDKEITFSNGYAIGITTRTNVQNFTDICLFNEHSKSDKRYIILNELINYDRVTNIKTNDFSPENSSHTIFAGKEVSLYKIPGNKLFHINIFSDFAGINEDNPNGLVQFEIDKRINFNTKKFKAGHRNFGFGLGTFFLPFVQLSKIEENNRYLPFSSGFDSDSNQVFFTNSLQITRHNRFNAGGIFNLIEIEGPAKFNLNGFFNFGLTQLKDSIQTTEGYTYTNLPINTLGYGFEVNFIFNPESKWSFQINNRYTNNNNLNNQIEYRSQFVNTLTPMNKALMRHELLFAWNTSGNNFIFGRYRLNYELKNWFNNYSEFQIGFSKYLKSSK